MRIIIVLLALGISVNASAKFQTHYGYHSWAIATDYSPQVRINFNERGLPANTRLTNQFIGLGVRFTGTNTRVTNDHALRAKNIYLFKDGKAAWRNGQIAIKLSRPASAVLIEYPISSQVSIYRGSRRLHQTPFVGRTMKSFLRQTGGGRVVRPVALEKYTLGISSKNGQTFDKIIIDGHSGPTYLDTLVLVYHEPKGITHLGCWREKGRALRNKTVQFVHAENTRKEIRANAHTDHNGCYKVGRLKKGLWSSTRIIAPKTSATLLTCWTDGFRALRGAPLRIIQYGGKRKTVIRARTDLAGCYTAHVKTGVWLDMMIR